MSSKDSYLRKLSKINGLIADARERIERQEARVIAGPDRGGCGESVRLLHNLKQSLQLLVQSRAMTIEERANQQRLIKRRREMWPTTWPTTREEWYVQLASTNRRIVETRRLIDNQKSLICTLKERGYCAGKPLALLRLVEETLQVRCRWREVTLEKVRTYRLPVCDQHSLHWSDTDEVRQS